jgi:hypothetical protein
VIDGHHFPGEESYVVNVSIEPAKNRKLYVGGYRSRKTGLEYHNAFTQTPKKVPIPKNV